jgi:hypothetical protein
MSLSAAHAFLSLSRCLPPCADRETAQINMEIATLSISPESNRLGSPTLPRHAAINRVAAQQEGIVPNHRNLNRSEKNVWRKS